jgi:flagellar biosynthesis component FlhA
MRLVKVLAAVAAVLVVFIVISSLLHLFYLIAVGVVIAAAIYAAFKVHEKYKLARQNHEQARLQRNEARMQRDQEREGRRRHRDEPRSVAPAPPPATRIQPDAPAQRGAPAPHDIEAELERLKRDMR